MPFAGYEDFDACIGANGDKDDPGAYCGAVKRDTEKMHKVLKGLGDLEGRMDKIGPLAAIGAVVGAGAMAVGEGINALGDAAQENMSRGDGPEVEKAGIGLHPRARGLEWRPSTSRWVKPYSAKRPKPTRQVQPKRRPARRVSIVSRPPTKLTPQQMAQILARRGESDDEQE